MIGLALVVLLLVVAIGLIMKVALDWRKPVSLYNDRPYHISGLEFVVVSLLMTIVFVPTVLAVGKKLSVDNIVRYEQYVNGVETEAIDNVTTCYAGHTGDSVAAGLSNCRWVYQSGMNYWTTTRTVEDCATDTKGNRSCTSRPVTDHHSAPIYTPYATREHTFSVKASVGFKELEFHYDTVYLDQNPQPYSAKAIRKNIPRGVPEDWSEARQRLIAGDPRSIEVLDPYDNYILASDDEVLKTTSLDVEKYKKAKLLPAHTAGIMGNPARGVTGWQAEKMSFVGVSVPDPSRFQSELSRYNAALGLTQQGDLHVVAVNCQSVPANEAVAYTNAVKAYWQGPDFGKRALAKNGIALVLGVCNGTIEWAKGTTGMPFGNERMLQWFQDYLPGTPLSTEAIFGSMRTRIGADGEPVVTHSAVPGVLERIMFDEVPFKRARMSCDDGSCVGYKDLLDKIEPTKAQKTWMVVICLFIALGWWLWAGFSFLFDSFVDRYSSRSREEENVQDDPVTTWPVYPHEPFDSYITRDKRHKNRK